MKDSVILQMLTPVRIHNLPSEILYKITEHLTFQELLDLRLVSPRFAEICAVRLAKSCSFSTTREALEKATHMATHPILSQHITNMSFDASLLADCEDFSQFRRKMGVFDEDFVSPDECSLKQGGLVGKFQYQYGRYGSFLQDQRDILDRGADLAGMRLAVTFPKLKSVNLFMNRFQHGGPGLKKLVRETFSEQPYYALRHSGVCSTRHFFGLMEALHSKGVELENLKIGSLSCAALEQKDRLSPFFDVFSSLKTLELHISSFHVTAHDPFAEPSAKSLTEISTNGVLLELLSNAPNLKELAVRVTENSDHADIELENVVGDLCWPHLETLTIGNFSASETELVDFFSRQPVLTHLNLSDVKIRGSWLRALPAIREKTDFRKVQVHGGLINEGDEFWSFSGQSGESMGTITGYFLTKIPPDFPNPLTRQNMSWP